MKRAAREFSGSVSGMVDEVSHEAADLLDRGREALYEAKRDLTDAWHSGEKTLGSRRKRLGTRWR